MHGPQNYTRVLMLFGTVGLCEQMFLFVRALSNRFCGCCPLGVRAVSAAHRQIQLSVRELSARKKICNLCEQVALEVHWNTLRI